MKAHTIFFTEIGKTAYGEENISEKLSPGEVLLKTELTLVSPGTEFACLSGNTNWGKIQYPIVLGYSAVARVLKKSTDVHEIEIGDRCLCYHSRHSSLQKMPVGNLVKIESENLSSADAVFCVVGAMGFQGVRRCRPEFGESLMVMGLGLLGLFAIQTAHLSGAFPVIALDFNQARRDLAQKLGADAAFSPDDPELEKKIQSVTGGRGCDCVVEITGNPQAVVQGLKLTARDGRVALVGCSRTPTENLDFYNLVHRPGITILGAHNMARPGMDRRPGVWTMKEDMKILLQAMALGRLQAKSLITEILPPERSGEIYSRLMRRDPSMLGVVFDWTKENF